MEKSKLNAMLREEFEHIPRGDLSQNELRAVYNMVRRRNLGRDESSTVEESLKQAIAAAKRDNPEFIPDYDKEFFKPTE